jgi:hypothetical protein
MRTILALLLLLCTISFASTPPAPPRAAILPLTIPSTPEREPSSLAPAAKALTDAIEVLIRENVEIVIVRVRIDDGLNSATLKRLQEIETIIELFQREYAPRFRTVAWIEDATGAAGLAAWGISEHYFMPAGRVGSLRPHSAKLADLPTAELEQWQSLADRASRYAGRDPAIAHAMLAPVPLVSLHRRAREPDLAQR